MRARRITLVVIAVAFAGPLALLGAQPQARADDTAQTSLESGTFAKPVKRKTPKFPLRYANAGVEGWVEVSYVIKPDGTVGETIIENSSGHKAFERATIKSIKNWRYEPATMNGEPIEQCHTKVRIMFTLDEGPYWNRGAKKSFKNHYKRVLQLLENGKLDETHAKIDENRTSDQVLAIEGEIGEAREEHHGAGMWLHTLLRRTAGIEPISGTLERVELRCNWRRVKAKPEKGRAWRIPPEWGDCSIYVFGEPGSTFRLLEYSPMPS